MDTGLFFLGALGAFVTVYLAKQQAIPEFRAFYDTSGNEKETREIQSHIRKIEKHIDSAQAKLEAEPAPGDDAVAALAEVIQSYQAEIGEDRKRQQALEREIKRSQATSRALGFLSYIVLGGVFGALLAGRVTVEGLSGDFPPYFQSIVIGATWTAYLSTIGLSLGREKANDRIEAAAEATTGKIEASMRSLTSKVEEIVEKAETTDKKAEPVLLPEVRAVLGEGTNAVDAVVRNEWDMTRQLVQRDLR